MHPNVVKEAELFDRYVELPMWMSTLSLEEESIPYKKQKIQEAKNIIAREDRLKKMKKS